MRFHPIPPVLILVLLACQMSQAADQSILQLVIGLERAGKFNDAKVSLISHLKTNPDDFQAHYLLANQHVHLKEFKEAIREYQIAALLSPGTAVAGQCAQAIDSCKPHLAKQGSGKTMAITSGSSSLGKIKRTRQGTFEMSGAESRYMTAISSQFKDSVEADNRRLKMLAGGSLGARRPARFNALDSRDQMEGLASEQYRPAPSPSPERFAKLGSYELVLLIDKSASMTVRDCPGGLSRWQWCARETEELSKYSGKYLNRNVNIAVFSTGCQILPDQNISQVSKIFGGQQPDGGTNTGAALSTVLNFWSGHGAFEKGKARKLLIAVVTDGVPTDGARLIDTIVEASKGVRHADDVHLVFLQVGDDVQGSSVLEDLDTQLGSRGARYDLVSVIDFGTLAAGGLAEQLIKEVEAIAPVADGSGQPGFGKTPKKK